MPAFKAAGVSKPKTFSQLLTDAKTAIAAYKTVLKLAPTDPIAPQVRQHLKVLKQAALQQAAQQQATRTNGG